MRCPRSVLVCIHLVARDERAASVCRGLRCCHVESPQSNQVSAGFIGRDAGLLLAHASSSRGELSPASSVLQRNGSDGTRWTDETGPWRFGGMSGNCDWLRCMFGAMSRRLTGMSKWKAGPLAPLPGGGIVFPPPCPPLQWPLPNLVPLPLSIAGRKMAAMLFWLWAQVNLAAGPAARWGHSMRLL